MKTILGPYYLAAVVLAIVAAVFFLAHDSDPRANGKTLSQWLYLLDHGAHPVTPEERKQANEAIRSMGTNALPQLINMLHCSDSTFRKKLFEIIPRRKLLAFGFRAEDYYIRWRALMGIKALGPIARPALNDVVALLQYDDHFIASNAAEALAAMGSAAIQSAPVLAKIVVDDLRWGPTRTSAGIALRSMGMAASNSVGTIEPALTNKDSQIRVIAIWTISAISPEKSLLVPKFVAELADPDAEVRRAAAVALAKLGTNAVAAEPSLVKLEGDIVASVRAEATNAVEAVRLTHVSDPKAVYEMNFNGAPIGMILSEFESISGKKVVKTNVPNRIIRLQTPRRMTKEEVLQLIEDELKLQAHVILVPNDDGTLIATPSR